MLMDYVWPNGKTRFFTFSKSFTSWEYQNISWEFCETVIDAVLSLTRNKLKARHAFEVCWWFTFACPNLCLKVHKSGNRLFQIILKNRAASLLQGNTVPLVLYYSAPLILKKRNTVHWKSQFFSSPTPSRLFRNGAPKNSLHIFNPSSHVESCSTPGTDTTPVTSFWIPPRRDTHSDTSPRHQSKDLPKSPNPLTHFAPFFLSIISPPRNRRQQLRIAVQRESRVTFERVESLIQHGLASRGRRSLLPAEKFPSIRFTAASKARPGIDLSQPSHRNRTIISWSFRGNRGDRRGIDRAIRFEIPRPEHGGVASGSRDESSRFVGFLRGRVLSTWW